MGSSGYAVFSIGGKQYRLSRGERIVVDNVEPEPGEELELKGAQFASCDGEPIVDPVALSNVSAKLKVVDKFKGEKVIVFKYKPKKRYRLKRGHRQRLALLEVVDIAFSPQEAK